MGAAQDCRRSEEGNSAICAWTSASKGSLIKPEARTRRESSQSEMFGWWQHKGWDTFQAIECRDVPNIQDKTHSNCFLPHVSKCIRPDPCSAR